MLGHLLLAAHIYLLKRNFLGPSNLKNYSKVRINVPTEEYDHYERSHKKMGATSIWDIDEVQTVPNWEDASYDPRPQPEFDIKYRQAVTSEDVFLQVRVTSLIKYL